MSTLQFLHLILQSFAIKEGGGYAIYGLTELKRLQFGRLAFFSFLTKYIQLEHAKITLM